MDLQIVTVYCIADDLLIAQNHCEDPQRRMSDAEVMTTAIVAALFFSGNFEKARPFLKEMGYIPTMIAKTTFNNRLHRLSDQLLILFQLLGHQFKQGNANGIYIIDTVPLPVCDNIRIDRCQIYSDEQYRGYQASKKRYFYGLKIHLLVCETGQPVEFFFTPGAESDVSGLTGFEFSLPEKSVIYADKAYNWYALEDCLKEAGLSLEPIRKKNLKRQFEPWEQYIQSYHRQRIETSASMLERLLPRSIHAVTSKGFELKVLLFLIAVSLNFLFIA